MLNFYLFIYLFLSLLTIEVNSMSWPRECACGAIMALASCIQACHGLDNVPKWDCHGLGSMLTWGYYDLGNVHAGLPWSWPHSQKRLFGLTNMPTSMPVCTLHHLTLPVDPCHFPKLCS